LGLLLVVGQEHIHADVGVQVLGRQSSMVVCVLARCRRHSSMHIKYQVLSAGDLNWQIDELSLALGRHGQAGLLALVDSPMLCESWMRTSRLSSHWIGGDLS